MKHALLAAALLLAACGPVYRTNYNLLPPPTQAGQLCASNVKLMSDTCVSNCTQMARSCYNPGGFSTSIGFGNRGYIGNGVGYESSILDDRDCSPRQCEESCLASARTAHQSCGGTITQETVCTSNCPPPAPAK